MRNGNPIQLGAGRYIQDNNALELTGGEIKRLGGTKVFIIGGQTALDVSFDKIKKSLEADNINYKVHVFKGFCSMDQINRLSDEANSFDADVIIGVGGGKAIDTAKGVSLVTEKRIVTIPTTAAQCSSYAVIIVQYTNDGAVIGNLFLQREIDAVIVDTGILVNKCPPRMLASGIGDSLAKLPEISFSMIHSTDWEKSVLPTAALEVARHNWDVYMKIGQKAYEDVKNFLITSEVEDTICTNLALTGLTSSLTSGGKQLALAHNFYDSVCMHFKDIQAKYFHGELVTVGMPLQMTVNGCPKEEVEAFRKFMRSIDVPVSLRDIGFDATDKNVRISYDYIVDKMNLNDPAMRELVWNSMESIL